MSWLGYVLFAGASRLIEGGMDLTGLSVIVGLVGAVAGPLIAWRAVSISREQNRLTKRHNRLSVKPHLDFEVSFGARKFPFGVTIRNNGLGPAIVTGWKISIDGKEVECRNPPDWKRLMDSLGWFNREFVFNFFERGYAIQRGAGFSFIELDGHSDTRHQQALKTAVDSLEIEVLYSSMYEEEEISQKLSKAGPF